MNCGKCGQPLDQGAVFCGNCGQQVVLPVQQTTQAPSQNLATTAPVAPASMPAAIPAAPAAVPAVAQPIPASAPLSPAVPETAIPPAGPSPAAPIVPSPAIPAAPIYATPAAQSNSSQPLIAMILGILAILTSLLAVGLLLGIAAVIVGSIGSKKSGSRGMAIAGIVMGSIAIAIVVILFIIGVLIGIQETQSSSMFLLPLLRS
ncbi:hypothetical protein JNM87_04990 [Candidatus Saccharibacteria bacterium]|nr:hypothetical protein [Candidatus Saccharibacteria bacterium]